MMPASSITSRVRSEIAFIGLTSSFRGSGSFQEGRPGKRGLDRIQVAFAGADADEAIHRNDEDLAVADRTGFGRLDDGIDGGIGLVGADEEFDFEFGDEIDLVLGAAVDFGVAALAAEALTS